MSAEFLGEQFLHQNNPRLHASVEVDTVVRYLQDNGEHIPNSPVERIHSYLGFLANPAIVNDGMLSGDQSSIDRQVARHVIRPEDFPESFYELHQRILYEQGHGHVEFTEDDKKQIVETIQSDQSERLKSWAEYLTDASNDYEDWFKYYVMHNVATLSQYDPENEKFKRRSRTTTEPVPELNPEAIGILHDAITKAESPLAQTNFAKLYKQALHEAHGSLNPELLKTVAGEWKKFTQNSEKDVTELVDSLQGKGTGWCTASRATAAAQLTSGDFYVFYSYDKTDNPSVPRVAIRMSNGRVAEMRGILIGQNIENDVLPIATEKLATLPGSERFLQAQEDMSFLTTITNKSRAGYELSVEELRFLYQMDRNIVGFGYGLDPRIDELKSERNKRQDYALMFDVDVKDVATSYSELCETTVMYFGAFPVAKLGSQGFAKYPQLKYFSESPNFSRIKTQRLTTDDAKWLIDRGYSESVINSLWVFKDLSFGKAVDLLATNPDEFKKHGSKLLGNMYIYNAGKLFEKRHFYQFLDITDKFHLLLSSIPKFRDLDETEAIALVYDQAERRGQIIDLKLISFEHFTPDATKSLVDRLLDNNDISDALLVESSVAVDPLEVIDRYIANGYSAEVAQIFGKLFGFYSINRIRYNNAPGRIINLVESLFAEGQADVVFDSLFDRYSKKSFIGEARIIDLCVKYDRADLIVTNAARFSAKGIRTIADLAKSNFGHDSVESIVSTLRAKRKTSAEHAQILIDNGKIEMVLQHLKQFSRLDKDALLISLLDAGHQDIINRYAKNFSGTTFSADTLEKLSSQRMYNFIASNARNFEGIPQKVVIDLLLKSGNGSVIIANLSGFKSIDSETTQILIDNYGLVIECIRRNIVAFILGDVVAQQFINEGEAQFIIDNIGNFDISPQMLATVWRQVL